MPSLLERVGRSLTRKKPEVTTSKRDSAGTALEGFETVSPNDVKGYVPPSATSPTQEKSQGVLSSLLRAKSPSRNAAPQAAKAPLLSLRLPELSENGSSGVREKMGIVFEHQQDPAYTDDVLAAKRLSTAETLFLVQKTSSALAQKGLETPGIFKTFWHAQNPTAQRKLIIAFLQTLPSTDSARGTMADTTAETKETTPALDTFTNLLHNTSPYDLAEVFKWAVRHFKHDGTPFGTSNDEYGWYKTFAESEKTASYPSDAYSTILAPLLPPANLELLNSIFQLASSVAAYGEINGVSGSKLSRSVGWWLLSERPQLTNGLVGFLQEWDTAARILEHLFLAYVRDQQRLGLMPKRLTQLVKAYPYPKQANPTIDAHYLPRPKFSTQQRTVLFVRAAVPSHAVDFYHGRPIQLLKDAIMASPEVASANADYRALWDSLKRQATVENNGPSEPSSPVDITQGAPVISVTTLLSESAIHTLTSASGESAVTSPVKPTGAFESSWVRSFSPVAKKDSSVAGAESTNTTAPVSPLEWEDFTGTGFGGALNDSTTLSFSEFAPLSSKQGSATVGGGTKSSKTSRMSSRQRRSTEFGQRPRTAGAVNGHAAGTPKTEDTKTFPNKDTGAIISDSAEPPLEVDEALIDGWAEILTDKAVASHTWPAFALYELRNPLSVPVATSSDGGEAAEPGRIKWLAIETYANAPPTREPSAPSSPVKGGKVKRSNSVSSGKRARFGFFSSTTSLTGKDKDTGAKEDKKEKRKEHNRRASEISTDSVGAKAKEPASRSQADLSAPPAIAEEPEPTTPLKGVPEEKAIPDATVAEKQEETIPSKDGAPGAATLAPIDTLAPPNADGSRFVEGGTPGTIPESVTTEPLHEDKSEVANAAIVGTSAAGIAAATALLKHENEPNVPVSEDQTEPVDTAAIEGEVSAQPTVPAVDESQHEQSPATADEVIDRDATALAQAQYDDAQRHADEQSFLEAQRKEDELMATKAQADAEVERQRALEEMESQRLQDEARAESERLESERLEMERVAQEQAELKTKKDSEERTRLEIEECERQEAAEKQAELERQATLNVEEQRQAEIARLEVEELERQRIIQEQEENAAQKLLDEQRAEQLRLEAEELEQQRIAQELREEDARLQAEELERQRLAEVQAELELQEALAAEEAHLAAIKEEEDRLAAEKAEQDRLAAATLEKQRIADELATEEARLAAEEAEQERLVAEEREEQRIADELAAEETRLAAEKVEQERLAAEELEKQRIAEELAAEEARIAAEKEEQDRLAALRAEQDRLAAEGLEKQRIANELAAEETRLAAEKAEQDRLAAEELEKQRIADELAAEETRLAAEKVEQERLAAEELEKQRIAEELAAEEARIASEKEEQLRLAALKAEQDRLAAEELDKQRIADELAEEEARLVAEKEEQGRLAALKAEQDRLAAEELEKQRVADELAAEETRLAAEKVEQERFAAEELEKQRIAEELAAEEARIAAEKEEQGRLAALKAEQDRLAADELEKQRIADELAAEEARIVAEEEVQARLAAEELEKQRIAEQLAAEEARIAATKEEEEHLAANAELERLEAKRLEDERIAEETRLVEEKRLADIEMENQGVGEDNRLADIAQARLDAEKAAAGSATVPESIVETGKDDGEPDESLRPDDTVLEVVSSGDTVPTVDDIAALPEAPLSGDNVPAADDGVPPEVLPGDDTKPVHEVLPSEDTVPALEGVPSDDTPTPEVLSSEDTARASEVLPVDDYDEPATTHECPTEEGIKKVDKTPS